MFTRIKLKKLNLIKKLYYNKEIKVPVYEVIDSFSKLNLVIKTIQKLNVVSISTQISQSIHLNNVLVGISLTSSKDNNYYIPLLHENDDLDLPSSQKILKENKFLKLLKDEILENVNIKKIGYNIKHHFKNLYQYDIKLNNFECVMVLAYVLYCGKYTIKFENLVTEVLKLDPNVTLLKERDVLGIGKKKVTFPNASVELVAQYSSQFSRISFEIFNKIRSELSDNKRLEKFYTFIELPLIETLSIIEINGAYIDKSKLVGMEIEYSERITKIKEILLTKTNEPDLNINSTQQLGDVLFNKLNLGKGIRKKSDKTKQYLCSAAILEKLTEESEIPRLILDYRALAKIYSTYVVGLMNRINPYTNRIHTTYQNALTVTGRLSSIEPNLQNIPSRNPEGKRIRTFFVAPKGHTIIKADYSQVELRILAHIANIKVLRDAFLEEKDIHAITASQVFNVPLDKMTSDIRSKAKSINFGIIYGMTEHGLSSQIGVSKKEAKDYINLYFKQYPGIKAYINNTIKFCTKHGYVNTLFGRKVWVPGIHEKNRTKRGFSERTSVNAPIQGTSADICKIAMNNIHKILIDKKLKTKMIMQVHDEIVFEVPDNELDMIQPIIKDNMENVGKLVNFSIPLTTDIDIVKSWGG